MITKRTKLGVALIKTVANSTDVQTYQATSTAAIVYQVAAKLVKAGLLGSNRGRSGGYYITKDVITLADVVKAVGDLNTGDAFDELALSGLDKIVVFQATEPSTTEEVANVSE